MRLLLATENQGKLREMRELLPPEYEIVLTEEFGFSINAEESGTTFEENARLKAETGCHFTGLPSIADDSGLCVQALGGAPGVRSRRFGSEKLSDKGRNQLLLKTMDGIEQREAKFVSVIVCRFTNGDEITVRGECAGEIAYGAHGENGFGYDPIFYVPRFGKTLAELTPEQKNEISHRGEAMRLFAEKLESYMKRND